MNNPYYFTDRALEVGFKITPDSHPTNRDNSVLTNKTIYAIIETQVDNATLRGMAAN